MKKVLIAGCLFWLTACTPKEYSVNVSTGQEQLKQENFTEALTSFEKAQKEKKTEEVEVFIKAAHLLNESKKALNEGEFDSSLQYAEKVQKINSEDGLEKTINKKAKQIILKSHSLIKQQAEMEEAITKGETLLSNNQFDGAYDVLNKGNQNRSTDNQMIAVLSEKLTNLMNEAVAAKKAYEEKIAKEEAEKKRQEAIRIAEEKRVQEAAIRLAEEKKKEEEAAKLAEEEKRREEETKHIAQAEETRQKKTEQTAAKPASKKQQPQPTKELTSNEAVQLVKDYLHLNNTKLHIEYDHSDGDNYIIHVYEVVIDDPKTQIGHTATYGWYGVNKKTRVIYDAFN